jgi:hypothetical protein
MYRVASNRERHPREHDVSKAADNAQKRLDTTDRRIDNANSSGKSAEQKLKDLLK